MIVSITIIIIIIRPTEVRRDGDDHVGAADPDTRRRTGTDLMAQAVQQQVQAADRSLDSLVRVLGRQPAERSAAGAPGEIPTLQEDSQTCGPAEGHQGHETTCGLTVWRIRMWAPSRTSAVTT